MNNIYGIPNYEEDSILAASHVMFKNGYIEDDGYLGCTWSLVGKYRFEDKYCVFEKGNNYAQIDDTSLLTLDQNEDFTVWYWGSNGNIRNSTYTIGSAAGHLFVIESNISANLNSFYLNGKNFYSDKILSDYNNSCISRKNGTVYYFVNGICVHSLYYPNKISNSRWRLNFAAYTHTMPECWMEEATFIKGICLYTDNYKTIKYSHDMLKIIYTN